MIISVFHSAKCTVVMENSGRLKGCKLNRATERLHRYPRVKLDATADISGMKTSGGKEEKKERAASKEKFK